MWNCIFGSFKLFSSWKIDFWPFLKWQKMKFGQKKFLEIDLLHFTSFFAWTVLNFLAHCAWWDMSIEWIFLKTLFFWDKIGNSNQEATTAAAAANFCLLLSGVILIFYHFSFNPSILMGWAVAYFIKASTSTLKKTRW